MLKTFVSRMSDSGMYLTLMKISKEQPFSEFQILILNTSTLMLQYICKWWCEKFNTAV